MLTGKKITVGVSGGIAAYKAADIVSWLHQQQAQVRVAMTKGATQIVTPLTMKALSGQAVATDIMSLDDAFHVPHIDLADCDLLLLVPATANILAKAAHGIADELVSATLLACQAPILAAPAMHTNMYNNPATQGNLRLLEERGWRFVAPGYGRLACGAVGQGRLAEVEEIKAAILALLAPARPLAGQRMLVSAGPTYEYLDPVRFLGNRSSGKMGWAVAEAAMAAGAEVTLILGPCSLPDLPGGTTLRVVSALEMRQAVQEVYPETEIVVMAAAVSDYRPQIRSEQKIKKGGEQQLTLVGNPDILAELGADKGSRFLAGFAAETEDLTGYAQLKLEQKNLDLILANDVSQAGAGFDGDTNIITALWPEQGRVAREQWPLMSKSKAAERIIDKIVELRNAKEAPEAII